MGAEKQPLLPRPLTGGVVFDSLMSVVVTSADGAKLYHSPVQYAATFSARDTVEAMMGGMQVAVALRPELASKLVIGGLPRSRLPLLLGALGLTAGLIVTALVQLRREYELARLRTDFVSGVSHELRTPLAQIRMFSETLLLGRVRSEEEGRRSLEIIDQEARRLTHLVENLLHFSRSERQVTRLSPARAPLAPLVQEALEGFAPLAGARGVRLRSELAEGVVAPVDAEAFRQMLLNLLDNAIKYGPPGQVVTVGLAAADQRARPWVDDQGPGDGTKGLARARDGRPDLIILDLMLPGMDGFRVLRALREAGRTMPVLILTARGEEADKVRGLRLGADDYVTKPFGVLELLARVEALLRRAAPPLPGKNGGPPPPRVRDIPGIPAPPPVVRGGQPVPLTPKEFDLLVALLRRRGAVVTRLDLLREVWGYSAEVLSRTVDTHVAELRRKLETDPAAPRHILTVRKSGYRLER